MNACYNQRGVGDVLLVQLTTFNPKEIEVQRTNDVALLVDEVSQEVVGLNLFRASTYIELEGDGPVSVDEAFVENLQQALDQNDVSFTLEVDLSPKFVVGAVLSKDKHPNADKLSVCQVDVGTEILQIVCGAPNVEAGQRVVVAKVGAIMPSGLLIKDAELRGIPSSGMICSAKELDLPNAPQEKGILVLDASTTVGQPFQKM